MQTAEIAYQDLGTPSVCGTSLDKLQIICCQNQMVGPYKMSMILTISTDTFLTPKTCYHSFQQTPQRVLEVSYTFHNI